MNGQENLLLKNECLKTCRSKKGFTLVELMIVIAIIGIIAAIAVPQFMAYRERAYDAEAQADAKNFYKAGVHAVLDSQGTVFYSTANPPPSFTGRCYYSGWFFYNPATGQYICNAWFKHPNSEKIYYLDSQGGIRVW